MRTLWNITAFLAIVHLLALLMFIGWLGATDRLSMERADALRDIFAPTVAEDEALAADREAEAEEDAEQQVAQQRLQAPPVSSASRITFDHAIAEQHRHAERRLEDAQKQIAEMIESQRASLEAERAALEAEKKAWTESIADEQEQRSSEQFMRAVQTLERLPAKQAKNMLVELMRQDGEQGLEQAVAYINAMNAFAASRVIRELKTDQEIGLATDLLEGLRTFGVLTEGDARQGGSTTSGAGPTDPAGRDAPDDRNFAQDQPDGAGEPPGRGAAGQ